MENPNLFLIGDFQAAIRLYFNLLYFPGRQAYAAGFVAPDSIILSLEILFQHF
jgi:hypothetical protein